MKRRIIQQGPSSLCISLPSKWAKKNNLSKKDEINLSELNGNLIISCENVNDVVKEITISANDFPIDYLDFITRSFAKIGCDKIIINGINQNFVDKLSILLQKNDFGFEFLSSSSDNLILVLKQNEYVNQDKTIRRLFFMISELMNETEKSITTNSALSLNNVYIDSIRSLNLLLQKDLFKNESSSLFIVSLVNYFSNLCSVFYEFYNNFDLYNGIFNSDFSLIYSKILEVYKNLNLLYYSFDITKFFEIKKSISTIQDDILRLSYFSEVHFGWFFLIELNKSIDTFSKIVFEHYAYTNVNKNRY
jgi:hypothetical protein